MKYIFVDLGAYDGDSYKEFMGLADDTDSTQNFKEPMDLPVKPEKFECYLVEPNHIFFPKLSELLKKHKNIRAIDTGVAYTYDGTIEFVLDPTEESPMGSTAEPSKRNMWKVGNHVELHCFDFSEWIKQFKDDYVIVKMDIEGSEYTVLNKMLEDGTHKIMNQLWVEWHHGKAIDYITQDSWALRDKLTEDGVKVEEWH